MTRGTKAIESLLAKVAAILKAKHPRVSIFEPGHCLCAEVTRLFPMINLQTGMPTTELACCLLTVGNGRSEKLRGALGASLPTANRKIVDNGDGFFAVTVHFPFNSAADTSESVADLVALAAELERLEALALSHDPQPVQG